MRNKLYLAAPLFSYAERRFNVELKGILQPHFDVYLPQEDGGLVVEMVAAGISVQQAYHRVFDQDVKAVLDCDVLLIVLDGRTVDEGAAFELGLAFGARKACFGLQTDPRRLLRMGNNPMVSTPLVEVFATVEALRVWAGDYCRLHTEAASSVPMQCTNCNRNGTATARPSMCADQ